MAINVNWFYAIISITKKNPSNPTIHQDIWHGYKSNYYKITNTKKFNYIKKCLIIIIIII